MSYNDDLHSLSHTKWNCKYHVVFAPKYRRKSFYDARRIEIGQILRQLCEWKGINILEAEVCVDHIHMLIEIPPKYSVSGIMGYLKGKSSREFDSCLQFFTNQIAQNVDYINTFEFFYCQIRENICTNMG